MATSPRKSRTSHSSSVPDTPSTPETPAITLLRNGSCKSLEGSGTLDYEIGTNDAGSLYWRISRNSGGGFFSDEWVPFAAIRAALEQWPLAKPMTSMVLRALFKGKSANNPSFLLATLVAEGVVKALEGRRRQYTIHDVQSFIASIAETPHRNSGESTGTAKRKPARPMTPAKKSPKPAK